MVTECPSSWNDCKNADCYCLLSYQASYSVAWPLPTRALMNGFKDLGNVVSLYGWFSMDIPAIHACLIGWIFPSEGLWIPNGTLSHWLRLSFWGFVDSEQNFLSLADPFLRPRICKFRTELCRFRMVHVRHGCCGLGVTAFLRCIVVAV